MECIILFAIIATLNKEDVDQVGSIACIVISAVVGVNFSIVTQMVIIIELVARCV